MKYSIRKSKTGFKLAILTLLLLVLIITTTIIVRQYYKQLNLTNSVQVLATDINSDQYITKNSILMLLENEMRQKESLGNKKSTYYLYFSNLQKHLNKSDVTLNTDKCTQIYDKINELLNVINMENKVDFASMSLSGRAVAMGLADKIYELSGLNLTAGLGGNIDKITDLSGNVIYFYDRGNPSYNFKFYPLIITFSVIVIQFAILIIIFNKNYLLNKEADLDEFKKKRYA